MVGQALARRQKSSYEVVNTSKESFGETISNTFLNKYGYYVLYTVSFVLSIL